MATSPGLGVILSFLREDTKDAARYQTRPSTEDGNPNIRRPQVLRAIEENIR